MTHLGLFEGIGGFSLAARWMGWTTVAWCEWNPFGQQVLKYHFPEATGHGDITKTDFTPYANTIDILTGGFPCQPFSTSGKRLGTNDSRHLWPEMLRAIREVSPRWIVGENVRGITNWNGGMVFDKVQADLESAGYEVLPFLLPACAVNTPHRRDRVWFIANAGHTEPQERDELAQGQQSNGRRNAWRKPTPHGSIRNATNTQRIGQSRQGRAKEQMCTAENEDWKASWSYADGRWPTQSPVLTGNDGISAELDTDAISKKEWSESSLTASGNAIVPQVAFEIFKAIQAYESM